MHNKVRPIAFYLPQFYPTPENNAWWGKGFTEWTLVSQAKPLFKGHYQPHVPSDLGFYDLRIPEIMEEQAAMAKDAGLYGFMFYHYWFHGKRFLELPVNNMINTGKPDFPFCLCWANETWTKAWEGNPKQVLQKQEYSLADDEQHISYLCREVFSDPRYIKINGKPLFGIWERKEIPDIKKTVAIWQEIAKQSGFPGLYLVSVDCLSGSVDPVHNDLDAVVEFVPDWGALPKHKTRNIYHKILNFFKIYRTPFYDHKIMKYDDLVNISLQKAKPSFKYFPGITPTWDNTSRRKTGNAHVFHDSSPEKFEIWLEKIVEDFVPYSEQENFIFINAWNEWAEGAHLEPCIKFGNEYLQSLKRVMRHEQ
jgi:lipopolysaccharide biosynthesis protein